MTLTAREKLAFDLGTLVIAHWHNFHDFNYIATFKQYLVKANPGVTDEEAFTMRIELQNYLEDTDYKLDKGMKELIDEDRTKQH